MTTKTTVRSRAAFSRWADLAQPGDVAIYYNSEKVRNELMLQAARGLFDDGRVILYQVRNGEGWDYCAQRCTTRTIGWLARMSASMSAPYNPHAYDEHKAA